MNDESKGGSTLLMFLLGAAVGAAAGLLLSPASGRENRRRLGRWLDDMEEETKDFLTDCQKQWDEGRSTFRGKTQEWKSRFALDPDNPEDNP